MLVEPNASASSGDHGYERCLADHERIAAQVVAVQLDEVEGIVEHAVVMIAVASRNQDLWASGAAVITGPLEVCLDL
jgi:hypothetical protein